MVGEVVLHAAIPAVRDKRHPRRQLHREAGLTQECEVVGGTRDRVTDLTNTTLLIDDYLGLDRVCLPLARVELLLCLVHAGTLHSLFSRIDNRRIVRTGRLVWRLNRVSVHPLWPLVGLCPRINWWVLVLIGRARLIVNGFRQVLGLLRPAQRVRAKLLQDQEYRSDEARYRALVHPKEDSNRVAYDVQPQPDQGHQQPLSDVVPGLHARSWRTSPVGTLDLTLDHSLVPWLHLGQLGPELFHGHTRHRLESIRPSREYLISQHTITLQEDLENLNNAIG